MTRQLTIHMERRSRDFAVPLFLCVAMALSVTKSAEACIPVPDATGMTEMSGRRAVIWIRENSFEIIFQNQYSGDANGFAWIIPLPGVPTLVDQAPADFLDSLEEFTAPFVEERSCYEHCPDMDSDYGIDAGVSGSGEANSPSVTEWGSGSIGDLDYTVVSSGSSDDLVAWLTEHGFPMDEDLTPIVQTYLDDGFAFFAAKIGSPDGEEAVVPAVRFTFDSSTTDMTYPLRISAFNRTAPMPTTIWVISPDTSAYMPANYAAGIIEGDEHTLESLEAALKKAAEADEGRNFVVQYSGTPQNEYNRRMVVDNWDDSEHPSLYEFLEHNPPWYVVRLYAELEPHRTDQDLVLVEDKDPEYVSGWYLTPCPDGIQEDPSCDDGADTGTSDNDKPDGQNEDGVEEDDGTKEKDGENHQNTGTDADEADAESTDTGGCSFLPLTSTPPSLWAGLLAVFTP